MQSQHLYIYIFFLFFGATACKNNPGTINQPIAKPGFDSTGLKSPISLYTWSVEMRLHQSPGKEQAVIETISKGQKMLYLGERAEVIHQEKKLRPETWYKVRTQSGKTGWIYGQGIRLINDTRDAAPTPYDDCFVLMNRNRPAEFQKCFNRVAEKEAREANALCRLVSGAYQVKLSNGEVTSLNRQENGVLRTYLFHFADAGYFLFSRQRSGVLDYLLLDRRTGKSTEFATFPKISPDGRFALLARNGEAFIYDLSQPRLPVWQQKYPGKLLTDPKWSEFNRALITVRTSARNRKLTLLEVGQQANAWEILNEYEL